MSLQPNKTNTARRTGKK